LSAIHKSFLDLSPYFSNKNFRAGFSLGISSYTYENDRKQLAVDLGLNSKHLVIPKQVHSPNVQLCTTPGELGNTDAVISLSSDIVLSIQVADCVPLFILDKKSNMFGLVHAGWRGTAKGIVGNTMSEFKRINEQTRDLIALIGPSIKQCCFEIGPEVAEKFSNDYVIQGTGDRSFLDLQGVVINQLRTAGIMNTNIINLNECTCCQPEKYYSYRREGKRAGRMIAICGWL
jgi:YfiH family protein